MEKQIKHRSYPFKAKDVTDAGGFKGYASVFGNVDSYREIVAPGAFTESIERIKASGDPLPVLWQHKSAEPIGGCDVLAEDEHGLYTEGWLMVNELVRAKEAHALMKRRVVKGLSIGYYVEDESWNEKERILTLKKVDLVEYSPVTFAANSLAFVTDVKAVQAVKTVREFEDFLRDVGGFSNSQAKRIASKGWGAIDVARDESDEALVKTLDLLSSFRL